MNLDLLSQKNSRVNRKENSDLKEKALKQNLYCVSLELLLAVIRGENLN
jgi:hypothetical protein